MPKSFTGMTFILEPEKETVYATGWQLIGYSFSRKGNEWILYIKCRDQKGTQMVAFVAGNTVADCYEQWYTAMVTKSISLKWRPDKFQHT